MYLIYVLCFKTSEPNSIERHFPNLYRRLVKFYDFMDKYIFDGAVYLWRFVYANVLIKIKKDTIGYGVLRLLDKLGSLSERIIDWNDDTKGFRQATVLTVVFIYFPRILVFSIMLYEILINKKLEIFYKVAILLFLPVMVKSVRRMLMDRGLYQCSSLTLVCITYHIESQELLDYFIKLHNNGNTQTFAELGQALVDRKRQIKEGKKTRERVLPYIMLFHTSRKHL